MSAQFIKSEGTIGTNLIQTSFGTNFESSLCFPKEIFYAATFDVDAFLAHYKREYNLERLRDDLNIFLKVLELSMSDLINKDYPDFVNLSTNLVDLDKAINDLKKPLESIKQEVENVKSSIDQEINLIMNKLTEKLIIEKRRIVLKLLMNWQRSLKVTNEMIGSGNSGTEINSQQITGDYVERVAFEFCQLKNSLTICAGEKNDSLKQNNEINKLSEMLEKKMQELFLNSLNLNKDYSILNNEIQMSLSNSDTQQQLKHVLKSYALLSKQRQAEQLFADALVKPYILKFVNEQYMDSNIQKLNGVFEKILEFIDQNSDFFRITSEIKNSKLMPANNESNQFDNQINESADFDFLINSIWINLYASLDLNLNVIFSPADPDLFHQRYTESFEFINKFESKCSVFEKDFKHRLLKSQSYKYFFKKWPIQVYFQIRFQEIVLKLEEDLFNYQKILNKQNETNEKSENEMFDKNQNSFYLQITETLIKQLEFCWLESKCFLKCLLSQFWKLNLQLISRFANNFIQIFQAKSLQINNEQPSKVITDSIVDSNNSISDMPNKIGLNETNTPNSIDDLNLSVLLLLDTNKLFTVKLPNFFDGIIAPIMRSANAVKDISIIKEAFACSTSILNELQSTLIEFLVKKKAYECNEYLKGVNDIPRLYRRTNREAPKMASGYVGLTIQVIVDFKNNYADTNKSNRQIELIDSCVQNLIDSICVKFEYLANHLLESVKKMEDSLKKLHQLRQAKSFSAKLAGSMSDDDKIRLQLQFDIIEFISQLDEKFKNCSEFKFEPLRKLVEEMKTNTSSIPSNSNFTTNNENLVNQNATSTTFVLTEEKETENI